MTEREYNPAPRTQARVSEKVCKKREKLVQEILSRQWEMDNGIVGAPEKSNGDGGSEQRVPSPLRGAGYGKNAHSDRDFTGQDEPGAPSLESVGFHTPRCRLQLQK